MEITSDFRPIDPSARKRQLDAANKVADPSAGQAQPPRSDSVDLGSTTPEEIQRYVQILKAMNPVDLHKTDALRERILNGSYTASPDELATRLSDLLDPGHEA